jgi:hypothetical protein
VAVALCAGGLGAGAYGTLSEASAATILDRVLAL